MQDSHQRVNSLASPYCVPHGVGRYMYLYEWLRKIRVDICECVTRLMGDALKKFNTGLAFGFIKAKERHRVYVMFFLQVFIRNNK